MYEFIKTVIPYVHRQPHSDCMNRTCRRRREVLSSPFLASGHQSRIEPSPTAPPLQPKRNPTLSVITRPPIRIRIPRILNLTKPLSPHLAIIRPHHPPKLPLIITLQHILRRLGHPPIDKIAMPAIAAPTRQLQRRLPRPPIRQGLAQVVADTEPQLGDALHVGRAAVRGLEAGLPVLGARVGALQRGGVDAVVEEEEGLQVGGAG